MARVARWLRSLNGRIVLVTIGVSLITVLVASIVAVQLTRTVAENQARAALNSQIQTLSTEPVATIRLLARDGERLTGTGDRFAYVTPQGRVIGGAARFIDAQTAQQLLAGQSVSSVQNVGGDAVVVEGTPRPQGGAIVGIRRIADINAAAASFLKWIVLALIIGLAVAILAGTFLARRISRPLVLTARAAGRMAAGERGVTIPSQHIGEIDELASALQALDNALQTSEKRQREFLLSVSHEIRTPLTAIRGYAEALADGVVAPADTESVGRTLSAEAERLNHFVSDLLELARLEADDFVINLRHVDAREIVTRSAEAWSGLAAQQDVTIRTSTPAEPAIIDTDEMRLRQIVDGLIENALRVTPAGAPLVVTVAAAGGFVVIDVRDSGPGLSADDARVAFDRGVLNARYRDVRSVGTGLGLSIAHRLVNRLGGTIAAGSAPEGGALFRVAFPEARDAERAGF